MAQSKSRHGCFDRLTKKYRYFEYPFFAFRMKVTTPRADAPIKKNHNIPADLHTSVLYSVFFDVIYCELRAGGVFCRVNIYRGSMLEYLYSDGVNTH